MPVTIKVQVTDPGDFLDGVSSGRLWSWTAPFAQNLNAGQTRGVITQISSGTYQFSINTYLPTSAGTMYYQVGEASPAFDSPLGDEAPFLVWPNVETGAALRQITVSLGTRLSISVGNLPSTATRVVAVVDGGGLTAVLRSSQDVAAGSSGTTMFIGVPPGGPYRVRVIAYTANGPSPAVLRSGKTTVVSVASGSMTNASVTLGEIYGAVDPATPAFGSAGTPVTIKIQITDPGDFWDGAYPGRLWSSIMPFTQNRNAAQTSGSIIQTGSGAYQFSVSTTLPNTNGTLYYQVAEASSAFNSPLGNEVPFLAWPNVETGAPLLRIFVGGSPPPAPILNAGVYRNGAWFVDWNGNKQWDATDAANVFFFGLPGDLPVMGDWNGDGRLKAGVYRNGAWFVDWNGNKQWDATDAANVFFFGLPGDLPVMGDWNGDGRLKAGVYRNGAWFVDWNGNKQWDATDAAHVFFFGLPGDWPVMGRWNDNQQNTTLGTDPASNTQTTSMVYESQRQSDAQDHSATWRGRLRLIDTNPENRAVMERMQREQQTFVNTPEFQQHISTMQHDVDEIIGKPEVQNEFRRMEQDMRSIRQQN